MKDIYEKRIEEYCNKLKVKIPKVRVIKSNNVNANYNPYTNTITFYSGIFKLSYETQNLIIAHECAHIVQRKSNLLFHVLHTVIILFFCFFTPISEYVIKKEVLRFILLLPYTGLLICYGKYILNKWKKRSIENEFEADKISVGLVKYSWVNAIKCYQEVFKCNTKKESFDVRIKKMTARSTGI